MKSQDTTSISVAVVLAVLLGGAWYLSRTHADGITFTLANTTLGFSNFNGNLVTWMDFPTSNRDQPAGIDPFHNRTTYSGAIKRRPFGKLTFDGRGSFKGKGSLNDGFVIGIPHWIAISMVLTWGGIVFHRQWRESREPDPEKE